MLGLRTTIYKVSDLEQAKQWYASVFRVQPYFDEVFYVGFEVGGYELGLQPDTPSAVGDNVMTYWGVDDLQSEYDHCIGLGAKEHEAPHNVGGEIMVASVLDPWGNAIGLIYNPHFKLA